MSTIALAILCKTPRPGASKTRLSPPLAPDECAALSACFIRDLSRTLAGLEAEGRARAYAVYTPIGSEADLRALLPAGVGLVPQGEGDLGARLDQGVADLLAAGHGGAILINSDSPTLPPALLRAAVAALEDGAPVVVGPALDGGYTFIGLSTREPRLFTGIAWSTETVLDETLARADEIGLPVRVLDPWYDVDDAATYALLEDDLAGRPLPVALRHAGAPAPATAAFLAARHLGREAA